MKKQKTILVINGSASQQSSNSIVINEVKALGVAHFNFVVFDALKTLPHFDTDLTINNVPQEVLAFRELVEKADGIIICTPEYVFSIPSGLKNAIEWCVSTTVFSKKKIGLITASASGEKAHEELQLIMKTLECDFTAATTLLIQGIRGEIDKAGKVNKETKIKLKKFTNSYIKLINDEL